MTHDDWIFDTDVVWGQVRPVTSSESPAWDEIVGQLHAADDVALRMVGTDGRRQVIALGQVPTYGSPTSSRSSLA